MIHVIVIALPGLTVTICLEASVILIICALVCLSCTYSFVLKATATTTTTTTTTATTATTTTTATLFDKTLQDKTVRSFFCFGSPYALLGK